MSRHEPIATYALKEQAANSRLEVQDYTVTFYVDTPKPDSLPDFPYAVTGSAAGKVQMMAYVAAHGPSDARYALENFFPGAWVETVTPGRQQIVVEPTIHGMTVPERRAGLFTRMFRALL